MSKGKISEKQLQILNYIKSQILQKGYPPSVREICEAVHLKSTSSVHAHLETLEKNGYIHRDPTKPRTIEICDEDFNLGRREMVHVPIVGQVAAGEPIFAEQNIEDYFPIPAEMMPKEQTFLLKVKGESMINAGILNGDYVLVSYTSVLEREGKTTFTNLARNTYIGVYTFDPSDPEYEYLKFQNLIVRKSEEHPGEPAGQISGNSSSRVETGIEPVDNGDIYLFVQGNRSNRDGDTSLPPCTVLRISKSGMDNGKPVAIDDDYYVDLGKAGAGEYRLWRSYYLGGTRFCLQFFTNPGETGAKATHSRFGIFDYESKTLTWVSGAPEDITDVSLLYLIEKDKNRVTFGMETASMKPALYSIYADGTMKRGLEVNAESIEGVALLK